MPAATIDEKHALKLQEIGNTEMHSLVSELKKFRDSFKENAEATTKNGEGMKGFFSSLVSGKLSSVKSMFSGRGLLQLAAAHAGGGIISGALSSHAEMLSKRAEDRASEESDRSSFVKAALTGTAGGRSMVSDLGERAAVKKAADVFNQRRKAQSRLDELQDKRNEIQKSGIEGADLPPEFMKEMDELNAQLENLNKFFTQQPKVEPPSSPEVTPEVTSEPPSNPEVTPETPSKPPAPKKDPGLEKFRGELMNEVKAGFNEEWEATPQDQKDEVNADPKKKEALQSALEGALDELKKLSEEQLEELKKLNDGQSDDRKQKLEDKLETQLPKLETKKADKKKKEGKGLFNNLKSAFDFLKHPLEGMASFLGKVGGPLLSVLGNVGGILVKVLPALGMASVAVAGVAAAGAAGYAAGTWLNNHVISPGVAALTGGNSLGGLAYDGVNKVRGLWGDSDEDRQKASQEKAERPIEEKAKKIYDAGGQVNKFEAGLLKKYDNIDVPEDRIKVPNKPQKSGSGNQVSTQELDNRSKPSATSNAAGSATVNNVDNSTVVNQKSVVYKPKEVRNLDETYMNAARMNLMF